MPRDLNRHLVRFEALLPPEMSERDERSFLGGLSAPRLQLVGTLLERAEAAGGSCGEIDDLLPYCHDETERDAVQALVTTARKLAV